MRVATRANGQADGELVVISAGGDRLLPVGGRFASLLAAMEHWGETERAMRGLAARLEAGEGEVLESRSAAGSPAAFLAMARWIGISAAWRAYAARLRPAADRD